MRRVRLWCTAMTVVSLVVVVVLVSTTTFTTTDWFVFGVWCTVALAWALEVTAAVRENW